MVFSRRKKLSAFDKAFLDSHNHLRALHGCRPVKYDSNITKRAKQWAQHLSNYNIVVKYPFDDYGHNLFYTNIGPPDMSDFEPFLPVLKWYDQIDRYSYSNPEDTHNYDRIKHFTQVVWKSTRKIGFAVVKVDTKYWVFALYYPRGNVKGKFDKNVPIRIDHRRQSSSVSS